MLTAQDFDNALTNSAFAWNEWERQSLDAARNDVASKKRIVAFCYEDTSVVSASVVEMLRLVAKSTPELVL